MKLLKTLKKYNTKKTKVCLLSVVFMYIFCFWQNNHIQVSDFVYENKKVSSDFDGYKIVHISDLQSKEFGANQKYIMSKIKDATPDIILITGDIVDSNRFAIEPALSLAEEAIKVAPVYYVSGNHESRIEDYEYLKTSLIEIGVKVLENTTDEVVINNSKIELLGMEDPTFTTTEIYNNFLEESSESNNLQILLSHRPELISQYASYDIDMVFAGHAHGGQIVLPFIGPLFSPNQGIFPEYTDGEYVYDGTTMYVSRGLGNSRFPLRLFNYPHIVTVELKSV